MKFFPHELGDALLQRLYFFRNLGRHLWRRRHSSTPLLLLGEGEGDGVLRPVRVPLPREPREPYVLRGEIFDPALRDKPGHLLPERRPPHHPVPSGRQDVETFHRLVDDREVVRRVVDGRGPHPRDRQAPERRVRAASIDYTPDHLPIIDEPVEGFYVLAAGGHGMMWGPALGEKMAGL